MISLPNRSTTPTLQVTAMLRYCFFKLSGLLLLSLLTSSTLVVAAPPTGSELLQGSRQIHLLDKADQPLLIATIDFFRLDETAENDPNRAAVGYRLTFESKHLHDHFLSMKEMKCLEGPELWCHIPYPYDNPRSVTPTDLRWLEHDLLFLFKRSGEFGANFWNGIYYRLTIEDDRILGSAQAVDLNLLASPPAELDVPPVSEADLDEADSNKRWLPKLEIR